MAHRQNSLNSAFPIIIAGVLAFVMISGFVKSKKSESGTTGTTESSTPEAQNFEPTGIGGGEESVTQDDTGNNNNTDATTQEQTKTKVVFSDLNMSQKSVKRGTIINAMTIIDKFDADVVLTATKGSDTLTYKPVDINKVKGEVNWEFALTSPGEWTIQAQAVNSYTGSSKTVIVSVI